MKGPRKQSHQRHESVEQLDSSWHLVDIENKAADRE